MVRHAQRLKKVVDAQSQVRCAVGLGLIREEVWEDEYGKVVRFNLAFINPLLYAEDNGRVLGYDTAHGCWHRHYAGKVEPLGNATYSEILDRFIAEVTELRSKRTL